MKSFADFLRSNTIEESESLPLVHTTRSFRLSQIMHSQLLAPQECDVFHGEKLNYFFVGRPSYKYEVEDSSAHWMLPAAFVMKFDIVETERIFPFDSGGFKRGMMPKYISEMDLATFDASEIEGAPRKIIGAFFGNTRNYMNFKGKSESEFNAQFLLSPLDAEMHALRTLASDVKHPKFDDRQFTIELQSRQSVSLDSETTLAVVVPIVYMDDPTFVRFFSSRKIEILTYDIYPLEAKMHFYAIYDKINTLYKRMKLI